MTTWRDDEIRALLWIRADDGIVCQLKGTARDAVVYDQIARRLQERGIRRTKMQVVTKLKALKKMYFSIMDNSRPGGFDRDTWGYFQMCKDIWGVTRAPKAAATVVDIEVSSLGNEIKVEEEQQKECSEPIRPATPLFRATPGPFSAVDACGDPDDQEPNNPDCAMNDSVRPLSEPVPAIVSLGKRRAALDRHQAEQVVVGDWSDQNQGTSRDMAPVDEEDAEWSPEQPQSTYTVPRKKRKATVLGQVNTMISATMSKLRDMDANMQAQEDSRLRRLMDHERNMQKNLIQEMLTLHRTISAENHQRHLELVDRIMSQAASSSSHFNTGH